MSRRQPPMSSLSRYFTPAGSLPTKETALTTKAGRWRCGSRPNRIKPARLRVSSLARPKLFKSRAIVRPESSSACFTDRSYCFWKKPLKWTSSNESRVVPSTGTLSAWTRPARCIIRWISSREVTGRLLAPDFIQKIPWLSAYGFDRPSRMVTTMTSPFSVLTFSVIGLIGGRTFSDATFDTKLLSLRMSSCVIPTMLPRSSTPIRMRPPSALAKATISAAREVAFLMSCACLNCVWLSSPRESNSMSSIASIAGKSPYGGQMPLGRLPW